ncbi:cytochrome c oxidase polypeptide 4 [Cutibacterium acnes JCM 18920]|nr:cytochrome c oxidase polypeptide 4 [Cutibacterium acnes JCM 18920]
MVFFYVQVIAKKINPRPSDEKDAEVIDGAGPVGFFPPQSIWPFWCALVVAIMCLGPIFGWWISLLGLGIGIWAASVGLLSTTAGITLTDVSTIAATDQTAAAMSVFGLDQGIDGTLSCPDRAEPC